MYIYICNFKSNSLFTIYQLMFKICEKAYHKLVKDLKISFIDPNALCHHD